MANNCLCHIRGDFEIVYCPLHEAAPELLEALNQAAKLAQDADDLIVKLYDADAIPTLMQYEVDGLRGRLHKAAHEAIKKAEVQS